MTVSLHPAAPTKGTSMSKIAEYYEDYWAGSAPPDTDPLTPARLKLFCAQVPRGSRVLDVGCGRGRCSEALAAEGYDVVGADISLRAVREARQHCNRVGFVLLDVERDVPFERCAFRAAFMTDVIEHLFDPETALKELHRVLIPNGVLLLSTPFHATIKNLLIVLFRFDRHFDATGPHIRFFSKTSLTDLLRKTGFEPLSYHYLGRVYPVSKNLTVVARKRNA